MLFKCKACAGDLDIEKGSSVGTCQYCGTQQTLPKLDDDKRKNLYERANHFRRQHEFDKAAAIYESILNEDTGDAEAYWSLVLCKYGVDYVEDPATRKRIPTCNRTQFGSVLADEDYKQAISHADASQRSIYEEEARTIDGIQKGILEISNKEEPFDVFICYKETDDQGKRTLDSKLAQDLYHELSEAGFKVFFARITLEDKIGSAYEPYIFAALQSSKAMVVLGTRSEHFSSAWVKNEWSRYLALIKGGAKKALIPAYRDMDPYTIPEELSHLQAQDMGKLGFMQDLVRGIKKVVGAEPVRSAAAPALSPVQHAPAGADPAALLQRSFIELEDGNWQKADGLLEQVLNAEPQNAKAYVAKAMAALKVKHEGDLGSADSPLAENGSFQKALRFADDAYKTVLQGYLATSAEHIETKRKWAVYNEALEASKKLDGAANDSRSLSETARGFRHAAARFRSIPGFSNADQLAEEMEGRAGLAEKMAAEALKTERRANLRKKSVKLAIAAVVVVLVSIPITKSMASRAAKKIAISMGVADQKQAEAQIGTWKKQDEAKRAKLKEEDEARAAEEQKLRDVKEKLRKEKYPAAEALMAAGKYAEAIAAFKEIGGYQFGKYRWRILEIRDGKAFLITEDVIEDRVFHDKDALVTWETCTLRKYLNGAFYNQFRAAERDRILQTQVSNPTYVSIGGKTTTDKVFLLSEEEATKYLKDFPADMHPKAKGLSFKSMEESARYFKEHGERVALGPDGDFSEWWLRSPGLVPRTDTFAAYAANVGWPDGKINSRPGEEVTHTSGVRPAMWIKLK